MKTSDKLFVITLTSNDRPNEKKFMAIDSASGGYPYWSFNLAGAKFFASEKESQKMLQDSQFTKDSAMMDGTKFPPRMIQMGLEINNSKLSGEGIVRIEEIFLVTAFAEDVFGKIEKPKEVKYIY